MLCGSMIKKLRSWLMVISLQNYSYNSPLMNLIFQVDELLCWA